MKRRRRKSGWLQEAGPSPDSRPCRLQCEDSFGLLSSVVDASAWSCQASAGKFVGRGVLGLRLSWALKRCLWVDAFVFTKRQLWNWCKICQSGLWPSIPGLCCCLFCSFMARLWREASRTLSRPGRGMWEQWVWVCTAKFLLPQGSFFLFLLNFLGWIQSLMTFCTPPHSSQKNMWDALKNAH